MASLLSILGSLGMLIIGARFGLGARASQSGNDAGMTPHVKVIRQIITYLLLVIGVLGILNGVSLLALHAASRT